jgi:hypothetical protein
MEKKPTDLPVKFKINKESKYKFRRAVTAGILGAAGLLGYSMVHNDKNPSPTEAVISGIPDFHGKSAGEFLSSSPKIRKEIQEGKLIEIQAGLPIVDSKMEPLTSIHNIAWDLTPKGGDVNAVEVALQSMQNPNNGFVNASTGQVENLVLSGQEFIVKPTPQSKELFKDENS